MENHSSRQSYSLSRTSRADSWRSIGRAGLWVILDGVFWCKVPDAPFLPPSGFGVQGRLGAQGKIPIRQMLERQSDWRGYEEEWMDPTDAGV